jgi:hypothetical protein
MLEKLGGDSSLMIYFLKFPPNRKQRVLEHQDRWDAMPLAHQDVVVLLLVLVVLVVLVAADK